MKSKLCSAAALALVLAASGVSQAQSSDPKVEAMQRYERAMELHEEGNYQAALIELRKAYDLAPTYKLRYKIGQVCYRLQDYACALRSFEAYLSEGSREIESERRTEVQEEINLLRNQVGRIDIAANTFDAVVTIDDVVVGTTPLEEPVLVSIGKRKVTVTKPGRLPVTRVVEVAGGELKRLAVELTEPVVKTETVIQPGEKPSRWTTWSYVGVGAAGALAVGAAVLGVSATGAQEDLKEMRFAGTQPDQPIVDQQDKIDRLALWTDVLAGAAVVTLGTTLILTYARDTSKSEAPPPAASVQAQVGLGRVGLVGRF